MLAVENYRAAFLHQWLQPASIQVDVLSAATFELEGGTQSQEVELQIATSGHYTNQLGQNVFRFVSQPVSTTNDGPGLPQ